MTLSNERNPADGWGSTSIGRYSGEFGSTIQGTYVDERNIEPRKRTEAERRRDAEYAKPRE